MKLVSWNVNGLRAVYRKEELQKFVKDSNADVILFQETKSKEEQLDKIIEEFSDYQQYYHSATKPGYAGTAIWVKKSCKELVGHSVQKGVSFVKDEEGRVMQLDIEDMSIFSVYFPNGGKSPAAWKGKLVFYEEFLKGINAIRSKGKKVIWAGDINCAHNEIDLARPKDNDGKIGFHPDERKWIDKVISTGWVDVFRSLHPETIIYSYWHLISRARSRNVGWRIDYFFVGKEELNCVMSIDYKTEQQGSDHCPVKLTIK